MPVTELTWPTIGTGDSTPAPSYSNQDLIDSIQWTNEARHGGSHADRSAIQHDLLVGELAKEATRAAAGRVQSVSTRTSNGKAGKRPSPTPPRQRMAYLLT